MSHMELQSRSDEEPKLEGKPISKEDYEPLQSDDELKNFIKTYTENGRMMIPVRFSMVPLNCNNVTPQEDARAEVG